MGFFNNQGIGTGGGGPTPSTFLVICRTNSTAAVNDSSDISIQVFGD